MTLDENARRVLEHAQQIGAIGRAPLAEHIEHAEGFADLILEFAPSARRIADLGTGGGLPGLIIAKCLPDAEIVLLDGRRGRIDLLEDAVEVITGGERLRPVCERAELFARRLEERGTYDVAVARGFARPAVTAECAAPLLRLGGLLIVSEPPDEDRSRSRWDGDALRLLGLEIEFLVRRGFHFALLRRTGRCSDEYPRRVGIPEKRPLF